LFLGWLDVFCWVPRVPEGVSVFATITRQGISIVKTTWDIAILFGIDSCTIIDT